MNNIKNFPKIGEILQKSRLSNGLEIFYIPKKSFSKTFGMFATNFGSVDSKFTVDGEEIITPDGVAHFLEHKMFEDIDGNALQKFAKTGASPNAFTSHTMTAYHFECTDSFYDNLEILLKFVSTPYFTDENVEKEKGIIGQEIGMMDDNPGWQAYVAMFKGLYKNHTVRASIAGSVESISGIDKELLYKCHKAFYSPSNMVLVVCGDADLNKITKMAEEILPKESLDIASRDYGEENEFAVTSETLLKMEVSMPLFMLGYKDKPVDKGESSIKRELVADIALKCVLGKSSSLYASLYKQRLINDSFETEYFIIPEGASVIISGLSPDPKTLRKLIFEELSRVKDSGILEETFERVKKYVYGTKIRIMDQPDEICRAQATAYFENEDYFDIGEIYDKILKEDVEEFLTRICDERKTSIAIVEPK